MRICFYAPFKPLGHPHPSGDLIIAQGLHDFLLQRGHTLLIASKLRSRWIYWKPWLAAKLLKERRTVTQKIHDFKPDVWLSYHSYYKSPDLLGPALCRKFQLPYLLFQGIYSTKQRRSIKGAPGFYLNRRCLLRADHLFTNKLVDLKNLRRIIPEDQLSYIKPGIFPEDFCSSEEDRTAMHRKWQTGDDPLLISAAMFRPDVKTESLTWMLKTLQQTAANAPPFKLLIAGDGSERESLERLAADLLPGRVIFVGKIPREDMFQLYSAGDIFVYPGIRESLGMVFLEAQACGLPVVAFDNGGIPEVVQKNQTGLLTQPFAEQEFSEAIQSLLVDRARRKTMGKNAVAYIRNQHDLHKNYLQFEKVLIRYASMA